MIDAGVSWSQCVRRMLNYKQKVICMDEMAIHLGPAEHAKTVRAQQGGRGAEEVSTPGNLPRHLGMGAKGRAELGPGGELCRGKQPGHPTRIRH